MNKILTVFVNSDTAKLNVQRKLIKGSTYTAKGDKEL